MEVKNQVTQIIKAIGGTSNIDSFTNCQTRLRITVKNYNLVNQKKIKTIDGSMGCVVVDKTFQIVFGPVKIHSIVQEMINQKDLKLKKI